MCSDEVGGGFGGRERSGGLVFAIAMADSCIRNCSCSCSNTLVDDWSELLLWVSTMS